MSSAKKMNETTERWIFIRLVLVATYKKENKKNNKRIKEQAIKEQIMIKKIWSDIASSFLLCSVIYGRYTF